MKTEDILNLDCTKKENKEKINRMLLKVKPVLRTMEKEKDSGNPLKIETIEKVMQGMCKRYGYRMQGIQQYYEDGIFTFYFCSILKEGKWLGNVYGKTLWEVVAKSIIKIYADIKKGETER